MDTKKIIRRNLVKKYKNIEIFKNKCKDGNFLIIGNGPSTQKLLKSREKLRDMFDFILVSNKGIQDFNGIAHAWMVMETTAYTIDWISYKAKCPLIAHAKGMHKIPDVGNALISSVRCREEDLYILNSSKMCGVYKDVCGGILTGPVPKGKNYSVGTVLAQMLHFSSICGAKKVYLIGTELYFKDDVEHYYGDKWYSNAIKHQLYNNVNDFVLVQRGKEQLKTIEYFKDSAPYLDEVMHKLQQQFGMRFYSLCEDSLLNYPTTTSLKGIY